MGDGGREGTRKRCGQIPERLRTCLGWLKGLKAMPTPNDLSALFFDLIFFLSQELWIRPPPPKMGLHHFPVLPALSYPFLYPWCLDCQVHTIPCSVSFLPLSGRGSEHRPPPAPPPGAVALALTSCPALTSTTSTLLPARRGHFSIKQLSAPSLPISQDNE